MWRRFKNKGPIDKSALEDSADDPAQSAQQTDIESAFALFASTRESGDRPSTEDGGGKMTRSELVEEFFRFLFPEEFQLALPVKKHEVRPERPVEYRNGMCHAVWDTG